MNGKSNVLHYYTALLTFATSFCLRTVGSSDLPTESTCSKCLCKNEFRLSFVVNLYFTQQIFLLCRCLSLLMFTVCFSCHPIWRASFCFEAQLLCEFQNPRRAVKYKQQCTIHQDPSLQIKNQRAHVCLSGLNSFYKYAVLSCLYRMIHLSKRMLFSLTALV